MNIFLHWWSFFEFKEEKNVREFEKKVLKQGNVKKYAISKYCSCINIFTNLKDVCKLKTKNKSKTEKTKNIHEFETLSQIEKQQ